VALKKLSKKKTSGATSKKPFVKKDPFADESNNEDAEDLTIIIIIIMLLYKHKNSNNNKYKY
jgi:hypothetical protein